MTYSEPIEGEVRRSGFALTSSGIGYVLRFKSCQRCAKTVGAVWIPSYFEDRCTGCEVRLSGFPIQD